MIVSKTQAEVTEFLDAYNGVWEASLEELPEYLVHKDEVIRWRAEARMWEFARKRLEELGREHED